MNRIAFLAVLLVVLSATAASAWTEYYDGTALPTFDDTPWWLDNNGGSISVGGGMISISAPADSWCDLGGWFGDGTGSPAIPTMVVGARLKVDSVGASGMSLLVASTGCAQPSTPLGFGILDSNNFAIVDYSGGPGAGQNNPITLRELGPADNGWHTVYLLSAPDGVWKAEVDGSYYAGTMGANDWGEAVGYVEFAANTYWMSTRSVAVSFDWLAYGDETNMPPAPTLTIGQMKKKGAGSFAITDAPKTVTYAAVDGAFFYIEEEDRSSGVRVVPESPTLMTAGDRVTVEGVIDAVDGEAVIVPSSITPDETPGSLDPVEVGVGKVGGLAFGVQPATPALDTSETPATVTPATLNTTGLLVRVVGTVYGSDGYGFYLDDGSLYGLWVACDDQVVADGAVVGITGVSGVMVDFTYGPVRQVLALPYTDADLVIYQAP